jgi:lipoprotein-anchoring transpeptidase ErfK/SrfK
MQSEAESQALSIQRIVVSVAQQSLRLLEGDRELASYPVSTSKFGTGSEEGSFRTPLGRFAVDEMIGEGAPGGTIFRSRVPQGQWVPGEMAADDEGDLVLTRILWLKGLEEHNANTKERYIYIHGTNHEEWIGRPESQGCVRMRNHDVVDLFARVQPGTPVEIA